jgi:CSLREA domain-containing protein
MKTSTVHFLLLITLIFALLTPSKGVRAAGIVVNSLEDTTGVDGKCTLREAIQNANDDAATNADCFAGSGSDNISFTVSGTITLGSSLPTITYGTTLTMDGSGKTLVISGDELYRVLVVQSDVSLTLNNLTITKGAATDGGAGIYSGGDLVIANCVFSNNHDNAIYSSSGTLDVTNTTFSGNSALNGGGAIASSTTMTISNSTFSDNQVTNGNGAGIWISGWPDPGTATITNSTFSNNSAIYGVAGAIFTNNTTMTIRNSTFAGNFANVLYGDAAGGILNYQNTSVVHVYNTILANNTGGNCKGTITNDGNNIDSGTTCGWTSVSNSMSSTDPLLGALANIGGPTQTFALLTGSPAIDAGNDAVCADAPVSGLDQRGFPRPIGAHCDIGAVEKEYRIYLPLVFR